MVASVLMTSCQVAKKPKVRPEMPRTRIVAAARTRLTGLPDHLGRVAKAFECQLNLDLGDQLCFAIIPFISPTDGP